MNSPPTRPPDLVREASSEGLWMVLGGIAAVFFGLLLVVLGFVGPCFFLLAPILLLGGMVLVPFGTWQMLDPTSQGSIRRLGDTRAERRVAAEAVADQIVAKDTLHLRFSKGRRLAVTREWVVFYGGKLLILRRADFLAAWLSTTVRTRWGFETNRSHELVVRSRHDKEDFEVGEPESRDLLAALTLANPSAFIGYRGELERMSASELATKVDARGGPGALPAPFDAPPTAPAGETLVERATAAFDAFPSAAPAPSTTHAPSVSPPTRPTAAQTRSDAPPAQTRPPSSGGGAALVAVVAVLAGVLIVVPVAGMGLIGLGCGGVIGLGLWLQARVADLKPACDGTAVLTASNAPLDHDAGVVPFERQRYDKEWHVKFDGFAGSWPRDVDNTEDAVLVVCFGLPEPVELEECGPSRVRVQNRREARVVWAITGQVLAEGTTIGPTPPPCSAPPGTSLDGGYKNDDAVDLIREAQGGR